MSNPKQVVTFTLTESAKQTDSGMSAQEFVDEVMTIKLYRNDKAKSYDFDYSIDSDDWEDDQKLKLTITSDEADLLSGEIV